MMISLWKTLALLAAVLPQDVSAQQYLGDVIPNATYPGVPGSELCYFRVKDPAGKNNNLTLVNYQSLGRNNKRVVGSNIKRAVIIVHGLNRDAGTYMANMISALSQVTNDPNINADSVVINAPSFPNGDDKNITYPYWDYPPGAKKKASGGAQSFTNLLVWKASQWAGGGTNQYPTKSIGVSSYDVLDQLIQYYGDKSVFPNINQIVIAGHSLGAQTVQRYAAVGKPLSSMGVSVPVTYWIANPNSLVWLNSSRPLSTANCADYDEWRDGLAAYAAYPSVYNTGLVASGSSAVIANYQAKNKAYARGTQDTGDDSSTCAPFTTGGNRNERFFYFVNYWTPTCEAPTSASGHCDTVDLINMGHDGGGMMASLAGRARLFNDNFYGDGARSYDFGYPRIQPATDDPFPDPAYNSTSDDSSKTVYAGNMTSAGCYTDSGPRTLSTMIYDSTSNTIDMCTSACAKAGYNIAGMEYGSQCWCDNTLAPTTQKVLDVGCTLTCPGNSSQICGQANRLSIYSNGAPVQRAAPSNPEVVGNYYFSGCHNESTSGHALSATSYSDGKNMTLENCAAFCNGYKYFGVEYSAECYCGSSFGPGSAIAPDDSCSMLCSGNQQELCGGPGALSVYTLNADAPVSTITQGSGSAPTSTVPSASGLPSSSLCPATNGQNVADSNNVTYTVACSSDTSIGSYSSSQAASSYFDCMVACDNAASTGCVAFTYVGGANGQGAGTCYLKNAQGTFTTGGNNLVSGSRVSAVTPGGNTTVTSSSTSASSSSTASASLCPGTNGQAISDSNNATYTIACSSDTNIGSYSSVPAVNTYLECLSACDAAASSGCVAFTYVGGANGQGSGTCYLKNSLGSVVASGNNLISGFLKQSAVGSSTVSSTQSGSASTSSTVSSSAAASPSGLCPSVDSQDITDSNGKTYTIKCSSDTNIGSFANGQAVNTYADCMASCDSTTGCVAFTYVGGANGQGSGACYLKNALGSAVPAGNNLVSGFLKQSVNSSVSSSSTVSSAVSSTVSSSATASASGGSLCPSADKQTVNGYTVACSSDTNIGSYSSGQATTSYTDCMSLCNAASSTGCVAFTYVGGQNGQGSGTCYLKNSMGSAVAAAGNLVSGFLNQSQSSTQSSSVSSTVSSTISSSASASASAQANLCPQANGQIITDSNGNLYNVTCSADNSVGSYSNAQASTSYLDCMTACDAAASSGCQGFSYVGGANGVGSGTCWLKQSMADYPAAANNVISAVKVAQSNVAAGSSSVSSSSASSSSVSSSTVSSSTVSSSTVSSSTVSSSSASSSSISSSSASSSTASSSTASSSSISSSSVASSSTVSSSASSSAISSSSATTMSTSTATASSTSASLSLPTGFASYGCFVDGTPRALAYSAGSKSDNTPYKCASTCQSLGYKYAGTEYGSECWCANTAPSTSTKATDCNMPCAGDNTQTCGAGNRLSVYVDNTWTNKFSARPSYGNWNLMACYVDGTNGRVLPTGVSMTGGANNATIANCLDACTRSGLTVCGAEYYQECYGGNVAPASNYVAGSDPLTSGCNYPCTGNKTEACGGSNRILVYINNGTMPARLRHR
ncbi:hypothetical protein E4T42_09446 [Aureobasidium subglaciale]|nr:hypothetical protein E4T42_09446 [Aureobasidium subglaciale]